LFSEFGETERTVQSAFGPTDDAEPHSLADERREEESGVRESGVVPLPGGEEAPPSGDGSGEETFPGEEGSQPGDAEYGGEEDEDSLPGDDGSEPGDTERGDEDEENSDEALRNRSGSGADDGEEDAAARGLRPGTETALPGAPPRRRTGTRSIITRRWRKKKSTLCH